MKTTILTDLDLAIQALKEGEPVVIPTETVYGLAAPIFNVPAVQKIFTIKGRPSDNPLIAHVSSLEMAEMIGEAIPARFYRLAEAFWPGPLTLVVQRKETVPSLVSAGQPTIAIRMPSHRIARRLIEAVGVPLVAPSANLSGRPSPTSVRDVLEDLEGKVKYLVDGGQCEVGLESTVLSLYGDKLILLRPGSITREMLEGVLQEKIALPSAAGPILSPGMKYRHYAPKAALRMVYRESELCGPFILSAVPVEGKVVHHLSGKTFYAQLREADRLGVAEIEIYCDASMQQNAALMNRVLKAVS